MKSSDLQYSEAKLFDVEGPLLRNFFVSSTLDLFSLHRQSESAPHCRARARNWSVGQSHNHALWMENGETNIQDAACFTDTHLAGHLTRCMIRLPLTILFDV